MGFIAAGDLEGHIARVSNRGLKGGHTAGRAVLTEIYSRAMGHLIDAFNESRNGNLHRLTVFHNPSALMPHPERVAALAWGKPYYVAEQAPDWFHAATHGTPYELELLRRAMIVDP